MSQNLIDYFKVSAFFAGLVLLGLEMLKLAGVLVFQWSALFSPLGAFGMIQLFGLAWLFILFTDPVDEGKQ